MNISVFCSANDPVAEPYYEAARQIGTWIAAQGHSLVWGAGNCGLMQTVGEAVHKHGGRTIGMVPRVMEERRRVFRDIDVYFPCESLSDRKALMLAHSDVAIALPGGIGTLDEVFSQAGAFTAGFHRKRVILYNVAHFWDTTVALLDFLTAQGMTREPWHESIAVAASIKEIESLINA